MCRVDNDLLQQIGQRLDLVLEKIGEEYFTNRFDNYEKSTMAEYNENKIYLKTSDILDFLFEDENKIALYSEEINELREIKEIIEDIRMEDEKLALEYEKLISIEYVSYLNSIYVDFDGNDISSEVSIYIDFSYNELADYTEDFED